MIPPRARVGLALAGSLLLHVNLAGTFGMIHSPWEFAPPPVLEVELRPMAPPARAAVQPPPPPPQPRPQPRTPVADRPPAETPMSPEEIEAPADMAVVSGDDAAAAADPSPAVAAPSSPADDAPEAPPQPPADDAAEAPVPAARVFPPRLDLRFDVRYGLASGKQRLVWVNEGERYTLSSVAEASGLAGVFYRGRFVQLSRGRLTAQGLQPEEFWDQRGDKRSSARFEAKQLTLLPAHGAPRHFHYGETAQDALSLFFQLALDAPAAGAQLDYTVFNGKKLREYRYAPRGEVMLDTALGSLRTLHLERVGKTDGRFEAWLAVDHHYLPVRLLRQDEEGNTIELRLEAITP